MFRQKKTKHNNTVTAGESVRNPRLHEHNHLSSALIIVGRSSSRGS